jgi:hypothetical protein
MLASDRGSAANNGGMTGMKRKYCYVLFLPIILAGLLSWSVRSDIRQFQHRAPFFQTSGKVAKMDCSNHGNYDVSYDVNGKTYTGGAGNLYLKDDCASVAVNSAVPVWVSQADASYVSFIPPERALANMKSESRSVLFAAPLLALILFGVFTFQERKKAKQ